MFRLPNNVLMLSATAGTGPFTFTGGVAGYAHWDVALGDGDTSLYFARESAAWEVGIGTWAAGPGTLSRSLLSSSTGSLISWPGTGTREVGCGLPGELLVQLLDPSASPGLLVRGSSLGSWLTRVLGNGEYIGWGNADGVAGDPTLDDTGLVISFPRIETGQTAQIHALWSFFERLIFAAFSGGPPSYQILKGWSGSAEEDMARFRRDGASDYELEMREGGASWRRLVKASAADKNDADLLGGQVLTNPASYPNSSVRGPNFVSADQTITNTGAGQVLTLAHGLGVVPSRVGCLLVCQTGEAGYSAGDLIPLPATWHDTSLSGPNLGHTCWVDATNINVVYGSGAGGRYAVNRRDGTVGADVALTDAKWKTRWLAWI